MLARWFGLQCPRMVVWGISRLGVQGVKGSGFLAGHWVIETTSRHVVGIEP